MLGHQAQPRQFKRQTLPSEQAMGSTAVHTLLLACLESDASCLPAQAQDSTSASAFLIRIGYAVQNPNSVFSKLVAEASRDTKESAHATLDSSA